MPGRISRSAMIEDGMMAEQDTLEVIENWREEEEKESSKAGAPRRRSKY